MDVVWPQGDDKHDDHNRRTIHNRRTNYDHHDGGPDDYYVNHDHDHDYHDYHNDGRSDNYDLCSW